MNAMPLCVYADKDNLAEMMYVAAFEDKSISVVLYYNEAADLVNKLLKYEGIEIYDVNISHPKSSGYDDVFAVSLTKEHKLFVEPIFINGRYKAVCGDYIYIDSKASNDIRRESFGWNHDQAQYIKICYVV